MNAASRTGVTSVEDYSKINSKSVEEAQQQRKTDFAKSKSVGLLSFVSHCGQR